MAESLDFEIIFSPGEKELETKEEVKEDLLPEDEQDFLEELPPLEEVEEDKEDSNEKTSEEKDCFSFTSCCGTSYRKAVIFLARGLRYL